MRNFFSLISKDLKIFGRSRVSALVTVVVPLLIVLLVGSAFSSTSYSGISAGVYSASYSDLSNSLLKSFEDQSYRVDKLNSLEDCISSVRNGNNQICVTFPADLSREGNSESLIFHADDSRINLAYTLINDIQGEISVRSSEIGEDLVTDLIIALTDARLALPEQKNSINGIVEGLNSVDESADSVSDSIPDVSSILSSLNVAKDLADDLNDSETGVTSLRNEINDAISELEDVDSGLNNLPSEISDIGAGTSEARVKLNTLSLKLDGIIKGLNEVRIGESGTIVSPIKTEIESINLDKNNANFLFPTLIGLMLMFSGILLSTVLSNKEKNTRAYFRNFITPTSDFTFIISKYFSSIFIMIFQLAVLFSGLIFITNLPLENILWQLSVILLASCSVFIFFGLFVGHMFKSEEAAILTSISIASLMIIFSNAILPIESISGSFSLIAQYNPFAIVVSILKKLTLFDISFGNLTGELYLLLAWIPVLFILTLITKKVLKRKI